MCCEVLSEQHSGNCFKRDLVEGSVLCITNLWGNGIVFPILERFHDS